MNGMNFQYDQSCHPEFISGSMRKSRGMLKQVQHDIFDVQHDMCGVGHDMYDVQVGDR